MANVHQKTKNGVWYISYRQGGKLKHRSLGTKSGAEARQLKREIELKTKANPKKHVSRQRNPFISSSTFDVSMRSLPDRLPIAIKTIGRFRLKP